MRGLLSTKPGVVAGVVAALLWSAVVLGQSQSIINTKHNLSAAGPGVIRAASEEEVCVFCHTPHNATAARPLWNRNTPPGAYRVYSSNSLQAAPGQPTGSSKLCLSCHDGTIALGSVASRQQPIAMAGGITTLPPGTTSNLGTDLSDDHPVSFPYDSALAARNTALKDPGTLPMAVRLDFNHEMQCTSCHDAHDNSRGSFLVMDNANSQLCNACHIRNQTTVAAHVECRSCHMIHTAPSGPYLLTRSTVGETCTSCHAASPTMQPGGSDIASDLAKLSRHDTNVAVTVKQHAPSAVTCNDCHEPHSMNSGVVAAPTISPNLGRIAGINSAGAAVETARNQFEVCFKCHGDVSSVKPAITRQIVQSNTRLQFDPSAVSYHPVEAPGKNSDVPSLRPGLTTASMIYCTDCHASDTGKSAGGAGPSGPHGSNHRPLLSARYETTDNSPESADAYGLCYRCHDRANLLSNVTFPHKLHVVDQNAPCSVCHTAHGISSAQGNLSSNSKLINFDITVVRPNSVGRLEYHSQGSRAGQCWLSCHSTDHNGWSYPGGSGTGGMTIIGPTTSPTGTVTPIAPAPLAPGSDTTLRRITPRR